VSAAATPQLLVTGATEIGASAATVVEVKEEPIDEAPARVSIYLPRGYVSNLGQSAGTLIGTVDAGVQMLGLSPEPVALSGTIRTDSPALHVDSSCAPGTHTAVWMLSFAVSGTTLVVPAYVDRTTGDEEAFSSAKIVICLPNPYEPPGPGGRVPSGLKFVGAKLILSAGAFTNPISAGSFVWRAVITPWTANGATENTAGTIEAQSIVNVPSSLLLRAKVQTIRHLKHGRKTVTNSVLLSGKLLENLQGIAGARVTFYANGKTAGSVPTGVSGAFSRKTGLSRRTTIRATATVPTRETACVNALPATLAPAGCVSATTAGYRLGSNSVTATPRKR
jgi:hypothetical protein